MKLNKLIINHKNLNLRSFQEKKILENTFIGKHKLEQVKEVKYLSIELI